MRLARELVAQLHENRPRQHWLRADADGLLGYALAARGRPEDRDEAARLLVQSYEQLCEEKLIPARIYHALLRLVGYAPAGDLATAVHARSLGHPLVIETLDAALGDLPPDPELHNLIAWSLARWSGLEPARYEIALRAARRADTLAPDNPLVLNTLGVAQYRTGADEAAIAMLTRADERAVEAELGSQPANWAFIAMAHHRLDQQGQARAALARLEQLMQDPAHARADENRAFLAEARTLLAAAESAG